MKRLEAILRLPLAEHRNNGLMSLRATSVIVVSAVIFAGIVVAFDVGGKKSLSIVFALASGALVLCWWYAFISSLARLCSPINRQLIPDLSVHVAYAVCLMWLLLSILLASFFVNAYAFTVATWAVAAGMVQPSRRIRHAAFILAGAWIAYSFTTNAQFFGRAATGFDFHQLETLIAMHAVTGGLLGLVGLLRLFPYLGTVLWAMWLSAMFFSQSIFSMSFTALLDYIYGLSSQFGTHVLVACLLLGMTMFGLLGVRGERLIRSRKRDAVMREFLGDNPLSNAKVQWACNVALGYQCILRRAFANTPQSRNKEKLLEYCFGPQLHWIAILWVSLAAAIFLLLLPLLSGVGTEAEAVASFLPFLPIYFWYQASVFDRAVLQTQRERHLVALTAKCPDDHIFKRWFVSFAWRYTILCLAGYLAAIAVAIWVYALLPKHYLQSVLALMLGGVLLMCSALRNYSTAPKLGFLRKSGLVSVGFLPYLVLQITLILKGSVVLVALACMFLALLLLAWRWRTFMLSQPILSARR